MPGHLEELLTSAQRVQHQLHTLLELEQQFDDPAAPISTADRVAFRAVSERFHNRKHLEHLEAVFAVVRRKRLAGRIQAIQAALDLAAGLLAEEDSLSQEFLQAVQQAQTNAPKEEDVPLVASEQVLDAQNEPQAQDIDDPDTPLEKEEMDEPQPPQQVYPLLSKEEERVLNLTEPLTPLVTSVEQSRVLLRDFEARLPDLRAQLVASNGWFDIFYVSKRRLKKEVGTFLRALRREQKRKVAVPKSVEQQVYPDVARFFRQVEGEPTIPRELVPYIFDFTEYGPYAKYRWRENKRTYTVSLGLDSDYPPLPF